MDDRELLRDYVEHRSEAAFSELVQRHVNLVFATAHRIVSERQLAQDVAQSVFIHLARKASSVREGKALSSWLYRVTCGMAKNALRSEQRRRERESEAMNRAELDADADTAWKAVIPLLDEAVRQLNRIEQDAIVLRFFEGKSLAEAGVALSLSEGAVQKRVSRALEKLRKHFSRAGVVVASGTLTTILAAHATHAAPVGLASELAATSLTASAASAGTAGLIPTLNAILMTKTKATILTVLLIGAVATPVAMKLSHHAGFGRKPLAQRLAQLPPLTTVQIEAYLKAQNRDAESLLAAYRASTNATYLTEAVARFPENPHVLYSLIANNAAVPGEERKWIDAYKAATPDNALAWYFSAHEYFKSGETPLAVKELERATQASEFLDERVWTIQAVEKLHRSAGRAPDEAWPAAFLACSRAPHSLPMKNLARNISQTAAEYRQRRNPAGAESLARMGLTLGQRLGAPGASQSLINTMVGTAIEKMFLRQLDPATAGADGQTIAAATAASEQRQAAVKELTPRISSLVFLSDAEVSAYFDRVKSKGEEAGLGGLKSSPALRK